MPRTRIPRGDLSRNQGAGDDGSKSLDGEGAVNREPEIAARLPARDFRCRLNERLPELGESRTRRCAHRHNRGGREKRALHELLDLHADQFERIRIHEVAFRQSNHAARDAEQPADVKVLARLRLDGFVGGDDQQYQVDSRGAGQHVFDEALVTGHIDKAEAHTVFFEEREAQIDGDASPLFFLEAVRMCAR